MLAEERSGRVNTQSQYYLPPPVHPDYVCYPAFLGRYTDFPAHSERRAEGFLPNYNLHLVFDGEGYVFRDGERIRLVAGNGFLFPRQAFQHYGSDPNRPWDVRWVHFDIGMPLPLLQEADLSRGWLFSFGRMERMAALFDEMLELGARFETGNEPRLSALLYEVLVELRHNSGRIDDSVPFQKLHSIRSTADAIHNRCGEAWTLAYMARLSGYSDYHFLRLFQEIMGKTPSRFLTDCRMAKAKLLLVSTRLPVEQVAEACGYRHASYFIKVFRLESGVSPGQYRKQSG
jgi:AraC-like DNA-binding protein